MELKKIALQSNTRTWSKYSAQTWDVECSQARGVQTTWIKGEISKENKYGENKWKLANAFAAMQTDDEITVKWLHQWLEVIQYDCSL